MLVATLLVRYCFRAMLLNTLHDADGTHLEARLLTYSYRTHTGRPLFHNLEATFAELETA